jgi:hypothetical protein
MFGCIMHTNVILHVLFDMINFFMAHFMFVFWVMFADVCCGTTSTYLAPRRFGP